MAEIGMAPSPDEVLALFNDAYPFGPYEACQWRFMGNDGGTYRVRVMTVPVDAFGAVMSSRGREMADWKPRLHWRVRVLNDLENGRPEYGGEFANPAACGLFVNAVVHAILTADS